MSSKGPGEMAVITSTVNTQVDRFFVNFFFSLMPRSFYTMKMQIST